MLTDENLIRQVIKLFEEKTGWGVSTQWSNQDFLQLSELIREQTGVTISHVTLKRIWGKVKYESLPNTHTLNTLVQFLGYENWRDFSVRRSNCEGAEATGSTGVLGADASSGGTVVAGGAPEAGEKLSGDTAGPAAGGLANPAAAGNQTPGANGVAKEDKEGRMRRRERWMRRAVWATVPVALVFLVLLFLHGQQPSPQAQDYVFNSKKTVSVGLPNSVIFNYDATRSPDDSVIIQQSWDTTRRVKVAKNAHQYTSIYYYPDFYHATLQVHGKVVKSHNLLIESNGWLPLVAQDPVPVYFTKADVMVNGKMQLTADQIKQKNIPMQPNPPTVFFSNVRDFGEIYSDNFTFEASFRDDYSEGSGACQLTRVYLLCEGTAIWIPLAAKGCVSNVDLFFTYFYTSGTREDLSAFGVDFKNYVKLRIESDSGRAKILVNDKLAYTVPRHIIRSKIIGIDFQFQGTGSVDYVSLENGKVSYIDNF
jgi:hypothetical protein